MDKLILAALAGLTAFVAAALETDRRSHRPEQLPAQERTDWDDFLTAHKELT